MKSPVRANWPSPGVARRGIGIKSPHDIGWLADLTVGRLMRTDPKVVLDTTPLRELREKFPPGSAKHVFVVSEAGKLVGTLDMAAIHDQSQDEALDSRFARVGERTRDQQHFARVTFIPSALCILATIVGMVDRHYSLATLPWTLGFLAPIICPIGTAMVIYAARPVLSTRQGEGSRVWGKLSIVTSFVAGIAVAIAWLIVTRVLGQWTFGIPAVPY